MAAPSLLSSDHSIKRFIVYRPFSTANWLESIPFFSSLLAVSECSVYCVYALCTLCSPPYRCHRVYLILLGIFMWIGSCEMRYLNSILLAVFYLWKKLVGEHGKAPQTHTHNWKKVQTPTAMNKSHNNLRSSVHCNCTRSTEIDQIYMHDGLRRYGWKSFLHLLFARRISHVWRSLCALQNVFGFRFAKRMKIIKIYDVRRSRMPAHIWYSVFSARIEMNAMMPFSPAKI